MSMTPRHQDDEHDRSLEHDLATMLERMQRRRLLGWLASGGAVAAIAACGGGDPGIAGVPGRGSDSAASSARSGCTSLPRETAGPFPSDGSNSVNGGVSNVLSSRGVVRSDIRRSFGSSTSVAPGLPLTVTLKLVNANASCAPLAGHAVYLWHCTRDGNYSLYSRTIQNENYLRGVQVSDHDGLLRFQTVYPGCYAGRWPHIHLEVYPSLAMATSYRNRLLTSQIALPQDASRGVYGKVSGYGSSLENLSHGSLVDDNVFGDNTAEQITAQTLALEGDTGSGYTGLITVGLSV